MTFDVRERLPESDGAFVGTFLTRDDPQPVNGLGSSATQVPYRYQVERVVKGDLPSSGTIEVWSAASGASCGLETPGGQRAGLLLEREGDRWTSLAGPKVITAPVDTGPASQWADLESGVPGAIAAFPDGARIGSAGPPPTTTTTSAPPEPDPGDAIVALPEQNGGGTGGRPILAGGAGAALLAAGAAGLIRRRRIPKLPSL